MPVLIETREVRSAQETALTKGVLRAADKLEVKQAALAAILGTSEATVSRMKKGDYVLHADTEGVRARRPVRPTLPLSRRDRRRRRSGGARLAREPRTSRLTLSPPRKSAPCPASWMSSPTWTPAKLSSELRPYRAASLAASSRPNTSSRTRKLVDNLAEQEILEGLVDATKPAVPTECEGLDYLLSTPFRYAPYPKGSRFRRAGLAPGRTTQRRQRASGGGNGFLSAPVLR